MSNIRAIDMTFLDELFEMTGGYVLDFSDRTFAQFFAEELNVDIGDPRYAKNGASKGKRARCFLQAVDRESAVLALRALWDHRKAYHELKNVKETVKDAEKRFLALLERVKAGSSAYSAPAPAPAFNWQRAVELKTELMALAQASPQARGFAFEKFLKDLFNAFGLEARSPFRNRGEQIDGSFVLGNEIYLLEAKWQGQKVGIGELHAFQGKISEKAAWTRGLLISDSGFSEDGLHAFGRGKSIICMDGLDLYEMLERKLPLNNVLEQKVRKASETGAAFARVRDLFRI